MDTKIVWKTKEFKNHDRDHSWYAGLFIFGAILVAWGLYTNNIISTILFVVIIFSIYILSHRTPEEVLVQLTPKGIILNDTIYPYKNLKSFWIIFDPPDISELNFETTALLNRHISIELDNQDPQDIQEYLLNFVEERPDYEENFVDVIIRKLKL